MKSLFCLLLLVFSTLPCVCQITTTKTAEPRTENTKQLYDSTNNFLGSNVHQYIGQELYVIGKPESSRKYGYRGFTTKFTTSSTPDPSKIYKCCAGLNSKYEELAGKYFKVLDVIKHPEADQYLMYEDTYYLKLQESQSSDTVFFEYDAEFESSFPFLIVGYFEKTKKSKLDEKYITRGRNWISHSDPITDINTGEPITNFDRGTEWVCIDLTVEERFFDLALILENNAGEQIFISVETSESPYWIFQGSVDDYVNRFGVSNWNLILEGKVKVGMTEEMCRLSWGMPNKVNQTTTDRSTSEQWVYPDNYLYFKNGVLTTIQ